MIVVGGSNAFFLFGLSTMIVETAMWLLLLAGVGAATREYLYRRQYNQEIFPVPFVGRWVRLGVLQQYVIHETLYPVLLSILTLTFFLLAKRVYELIDLLMANWSLGMVLQIILSLLPMIFSLTVPMAILVGVLLGVGRMAVENEIRACQTAGVHLVRIFYPLIVICALASVLMILVNYEYAPRMMKKMHKLKNRLAYEYVSALPAGLEFEMEDKGGMDTVLFFTERDPETGDMLKVRMMTERKVETKKTEPASNPADGSEEEPKEEKQQDIILAARANITYDEDSDILKFNFFDASVHTQSADPETPGAPGRESVGRFKQWTMPIIPEKVKKETGEYRTYELAKALIQGHNFVEWKNRSEESYQRYRNRFKVELAERTAIPLSCLAFVLLGIPLAIFTRPSGKSIGITIAFLLVLIYYWMIKWGSGLAEEGHNLGLVIIFLPNFLMAGLGLILLRRAVRQ